MVGLFIVLISPTLAAAAVIFEDDFDGLLNPRWFSDWGQWASQGHDGTNNPPTLYPQNIPVPRPHDDPGKLSTGVEGWATLRGDPVNAQDPPGCHPVLDYGPCDPATQVCYEMADGVVSMDNIDISEVSDFGYNGVAMGLIARMEGAGGAAPVQRAIMGTYLTAYNNPPQIYFEEYKYHPNGGFGDRVNPMVLPNRLETPIHMEMTLDGDDVEFTIGDSDEEYTINMVQGTFVHMHPYAIGPHIRPNPDPGRWGFFSMAALNAHTDYVTWDNFMLTSVPGTPGDNDGDGDRDGNDFLLAQTGPDPVTDINIWDPPFMAWLL